MPISLVTNATELAIARSLETSEQNMRRAMERLASGKRINHSYEDPAGSALSANLNGKIRSLQQAQRNVLDATSVIQVAEGGLNELDGSLLRMRELAIQSSSDSVSDVERGLMQTEVTELASQIDRMAESTRYLGVKLLNGTQRDMVFQVGIENEEVDRLHYQAGQVDVRAATLGVDGLSIEDQDSAMEALASLDEAQRRVQMPRAQLGAIQGTLHSLTNFLAVYEENLTEAHSRIHDTDYAQETSNLMRSQLIQRAAVAVLTQANQIPRAALKLLDPSS